IGIIVILEMGFIKNSKFRAVVVLAFIVGIGLTTRAFSQESSVPAADTVAQAVDTAAVAVTDTAAGATDTTSTATDTAAAAAPTTATGGTAATATTEAESGPDIDSQV